MYCIETKNVNHQYFKKEKVVDSLNLQINYGSIYGFLGPNGAGKTTTLRLILGLIKKQHGEIAVFGKSFEKNRIEILQKTGSLIESPSLYGHLTAKENLQILQKIYQCPKSSIDEVLKLVDLRETGNKKAGKFSLGMKQRLSIAIALLNNPELLILDEPTNGLDPNSIIEIRELLIKLNKERNTTILISSHLLSEIEKIVSHIGIIHKGKMLFQGPITDLQKNQNKVATTLFKTNNAILAHKIITQHQGKVILKNDTLLIESNSQELIADINALLVSNHIKVYEIAQIKNDLETVFMELINS